MAEIQPLVAIEQPEPISNGREKFGMVDLIGWLVNTHPAFNSDGQGIRSGARLEQRLREAKDYPSPIVAEKRDAERLSKAAEEPPKPPPGMEDRPAYPVSPARVLLPFLKALETPQAYNPEDAAPEATPEQTPEAAAN